jgi:hypothetical protein
MFCYVSYKHTIRILPTYYRLLLTRFSTAVFLLLSYSDDIMEFIHIAKELDMLNGDFAFLTTQLSLDTKDWEAATAAYGIHLSDVNGLHSILNPVVYIIIAK